ncbi:decaprenyl-phosphate phosphoribosyltransferase (plasmid) [Kovacikia minuta CCNUW1]|uniref:decaprenyl-phosphate phosphoribosyltransferase n=1 Tax=Kovacikia minuta TaxID=2931930 RepID=UPI001CCCE801|nr:decaprenyl-phosphate phosphoribosyltransferase [Kovacikia minuta]UBF30231.1 decaprenyl-phosphate phosphoribosyltransferase [Kovacikia minuta CCNUW1]
MVPQPFPSPKQPLPKYDTGASRWAYIKALRPRQWTKNLIVFAAPLFAFSFSLETLVNGILAFALFCATSSSFYLINDVVDVEADRRHPVKCKRPIASGLVSIPAAILMAICLLGGALVVGWMKSRALGLSILCYALLQIAYNLKLKRTVVLDVIAIATGFVLRAFGGASATSVPVSSWFLLCTAMLALFLGVEKRKAELRLSEMSGRKTRSVLYRYSIPLLTRMESTVTTGAIMTYALWSSGPAFRGASTHWMLITLPFVMYGIFRYQLLSDPEEIARRAEIGAEKGGQTERPEEVLLKDIPLLGTVVGWVLTSLLILVLKSQGMIE